VDVGAGLREWARGLYAVEAAVELLLRAFGGRFASPGCGWVVVDASGDRVWLDVEAMDAGWASGGEQRVLAVVEALAGGDPLADLPGLLAGLDRTNLVLVLAAFSHAAGAHEHGGPVAVDGTWNPSTRPGPVVAWPDGVGAVQ
jgi:hypothetical protein